MLAAQSWAAPANASTGIVTSTKAIRAHFASMIVSLEADVGAMDRLSVKVAPENLLPISCVVVIVDDDVVVPRVTRARQYCPAFWSRNRWRHDARVIVLQAARWRG